MQESTALNKLHVNDHSQNLKTSLCCIKLSYTLQPYGGQILYTVSITLTLVVVTTGTNAYVTHYTLQLADEMTKNDSNNHAGVCLLFCHLANYNT